MIVIRSADSHDLDSVFRLARYLDTPNLPASKELLEKDLKESERCFHGAAKGDLIRFIFAMEDASNGEIIGCCIMRYLAKREFFLIENEELAAVETIEGNRWEIGGVVIDPEYRGRRSGLGKALALAPFLFVMAYRCYNFPGAQFAAEYLPNNYLPGEGTPFWKEVGQKILGIPFNKLNHRLRKTPDIVKRMLGARIPLSSLSAEARSTLGTIGKGSQPLAHIWQQIGFRPLNQYSLFEGGPWYGANMEDLSFVGCRGWLSSSVRSLFVHEQPLDECNIDNHLVGVISPKSVTMIPTAAKINAALIRLPQKTTAALRERSGDFSGVVAMQIR